MKTSHRLALALTTAALLAPRSPAQESSPTAGAFTVRFDAAVFESAFTGQLFIAFSERGEPRRSMHDWFGPPPLLRFDVAGIAPGASVTLRASEAAAHHPAVWPESWTSEQTPTWNVQAVARRSRTGREAGRDAGDVFSPAAEFVYDPTSQAAVELVLDAVVTERPFEETERHKLFEFTSPALSKFHGFDYVVRAGVQLPLGWKEGQTYPVVYSVTGFGGTAAGIRGFARRGGEPTILDECIVVVPDASNRWGHSVFCNSDSIGPWGDALVKELIPALEKKYGGAGATQRYVTGVSSGGWSSLWLQVAYPDDFAGCWSHVPDPIDFHDFQQIDLYDPLPDGTPRNMYRDEQGAQRPLARRGDQVMVTYEDFVRREHVLNPGGQIRSFEATFSPLGRDGAPKRVFDVATGVVDHAAASAWRKYDISHILLTQWDELRPKLAGKIHVYAGEVDTFYLEGAVERFRALAEPAGLLDDMTIVIVPGMAHALHGPGQQDMFAAIASGRAAVAER